MPHFESERITIESVEDPFEFFDALGSVLETPRILKKDGAEASGFHQRIQVFSKVPDVFGSALRRFVSKTAEYFRREFEVRIALYAAYPALRMRRRWYAVKGRVDLDGVEKRRQIGEWIEWRAVWRVDGSFPVG